MAIFIVTGANGFLGNNIVRKLAAAHQEVRALVSSPDRANALQGLACQIFAGDVTKPETLTEIFDVPKSAKVYAIHCAAIVYIKSKPNPKVHEVNVLGTKHVAEKTLEIGGKLIYVNSVHSLPVLPDHATMSEVEQFDPAAVEGIYAKSKAAAAQLILDMTRERNLDACIVQPSGIIGPYDFGNSHLTQLIIDTATKRLKAGVKGGYDFVDVRDVADGILAACAKGRKSESYILSGHYATIPEVFQLVAAAMHEKPIKLFLPLWLAKATAPLSELYYKIKNQPPLYTKYSLYTLESNANFSHAKATKELDYHPRPLKSTIGDTVEWLREVGRIDKK